MDLYYHNNDTNVGMVVFVILSFVYVIYNKLQKSAYENKYNEVMEYVTRYEKIINEQGKKNHEYNNQLMVLKGYLDKPDSCLLSITLIFIILYITFYILLRYI